MGVAGNRLLIVAAFVVVVGGMKLAAPIIVPFLLTIFLAIVLEPPLHWLRARGCHTFVAIGLVMTAMLLVGVVLAGIIGSSIAQFDVKKYEKRLADLAAPLEQEAARRGFDVDKYVNLKEPPKEVIQFVAGSLNSLNGLIKNGFLILMTLIFLLLEAAHFADKLQAIDTAGRPLAAGADTVVTNVRRYIAIKTVVSLATGVLIAVGLTIVGVDFPLLWGLIAFLLNYVPNIGSLIAAIPAVLLALIQLGVGPALWTAGIFVVVNQVLGTFIEPRFQGQGLGLSTLVVFVSLVFWGWVLGPVGMFLSAPLTMVVKIALEEDEDTRWIAVLLGSHVPKPT